MELKIQNLPISKLKPYKNNPRKNDGAVEIVKKSIQEFGFKVPIIIDKNNEIIAGHTRVKAAKELNMTEIPVIKIEDLTPEQVKAFRIIDNKTNEYSFWDTDLLSNELNELNSLGFDLDSFDLSIDTFEPSITPNEPITTPERDINETKRDELKKKSEELAKKMIDDKRGVEVVCPKCGYRFELE